MNKVGLRKGASTYRHFNSKDDLFSEAVARAFDRWGRGMFGIGQVPPPKGQPLRHASNTYLIPRHANCQEWVVCGLCPRARAPPIVTKEPCPCKTD